jgi:hypothetical protein
MSINTPSGIIRKAYNKFMKIFVAHSSNFDFRNELYLPLRNSKLNLKHEIFLPQEKSDTGPITKDIIKNSQLIVAEVSYPSTGQGIELGWANIYDIPIVCIYKEGATFSNALRKMTDNFIAYKNQENMIEKLTNFIK